jgi:hypothetical protein
MCAESGGGELAAPLLVKGGFDIGVTNDIRFSSFTCDPSPSFDTVVWRNGGDAGTNFWHCTARGIVDIRLAAGGVMTSPVETMCVVTNVATNFPPELAPIGSPFWNSGRIYTAVYTTPRQHGAIPLPTATCEVVTTIEAVMTLTFDWEGEPRRIEHRTVLSTSTVKMKKHETWVPQ